MTSVKQVLFFSRGRGYGHAIPDMHITDIIKQIDPSINVHFVSYAAGARAIEARGCLLTKLNFSENNPFLETLSECHKLIAETKPDIVIAHEEFAALVSAKMLGVPSIFVSAWLPPGGSLAAESLQSASSILVIDNPGLFPIPPGVTARIHYSGPILRKMKYTWKDQLALRREQEIEDEALAILVIPGGWANEDKTPIADSVLSAYFALRHNPKHLIWLAGKDTEMLRQRTQNIRGIRILDYCDPVERVMAACNVVITKGTRGITLDAASVGVPSISLSPGLNPIDDIMVPRVRNNTALNAKAVNGAVLQRYIESAVNSRRTFSSQQGLPVDGAEKAAQIIVNEIQRLCSTEESPERKVEL